MAFPSAGCMHGGWRRLCEAVKRGLRVRVQVAGTHLLPNYIYALRNQALVPVPTPVPSRYFGGDLQIISMEGYGTDAYLHLNRLGNSQEPLP